MKFKLPQEKSKRTWAIVGIVIAILALVPFWILMLAGWLVYLIWQKVKLKWLKFGLIVLIALTLLPLGIASVTAVFSPSSTQNVQSQSVKKVNYPVVTENKTVSTPSNSLSAPQNTPANTSQSTPPNQSAQVENQTPNSNAQNADLKLVTRVVDGDTIDVVGVGRIRMIGLDTPEVVDPRKPVQCFGVEASNKAKEILSNKKVRLEADPTQGDKDTYGRALRYVYLADGTLFNKWMIENGFAHEYTYNIPYKFMNEFKAAEKSAREANRGLWSPQTCNGNTNQTGSPSNTSTSQSDNNTNQSSVNAQNTQAVGQPSGNCVIKGNISSSGEKIYHVPGGAFYNATQIDTSRGERWFCSGSEAAAAGWRMSLR